MFSSGQKNNYASPWQWTTVTATGEWHPAARKEPTIHNQHQLSSSASSRSSYLPSSSKGIAASFPNAMANSSSNIISKLTGSQHQHFHDMQQHHLQHQQQQQQQQQMQNQQQLHSASTAAASMAAAVLGSSRASSAVSGTLQSPFKSASGSGAGVTGSAHGINNFPFNNAYRGGFWVIIYFIYIIDLLS